MTVKISDVLLPVTQELLDDSIDSTRWVRGLFLFGFAQGDDRIEYRGGGWWRLDGKQHRGRWRVIDALLEQADKS